MALLPTFKAHCPKCDGERNATVLGEHREDWNYGDGAGHHVNGDTEDRILKCRGCDTVFFHRRMRDSEDMVEVNVDGQSAWEHAWRDQVWPEPDDRERPGWLFTLGDRTLTEILQEAYGARRYAFRIVAAIGLRTALDRATEVLGIDPAARFDEKLQALEQDGWIGATERDTLGVLTDAGNAAAHRGWSPSPTELDILFTTLELFILKALVHRDKAREVRATIPAKPRRRPRKPPA